MMTLDHLVTQLLALETKYYDLLDVHQKLIHEHETLKDAAAMKYSEGYSEGYEDGYSGWAYETGN